MRRLLSLAPLLLCAAAAAQSPTKLLRFPDIHADRVVFVYAGDLYSAPLAGGTAARLTSHEGQELYPRFSPDGTRIAFSAEYNGTRQVFTIPAGGGEPRQLTWYNDVGPMPPRGGTDNRVLDWSPDGRCILVRMNRTPWDERNGRPYCVPADGGTEYPLAVPESGGAAYSPDGKSLAFTPIDRDFRSWKRYRGGRAQDVWTYDLVANSSRRLTTSTATDHQPMWLGDEVFFVSDRALGTLNLYRMPAAGAEAQVRPATEFSDFDVLWPAAGPGGIVFEKGGAIWHFDPATGSAREIPIRVAADLPETQPRFVDAAKFIDSFSLSPGGERVAFAARGELFSVPAKHGATRNLSLSPDAREHSVSWSPDGKRLAFFSDATGEYELYVQDQDGRAAPRKLTDAGDSWPLPAVWSTDGKRIAFADKLRRLHIVDVDGGSRRLVDTGSYSDLDDYRFSPDGRWLAYVKDNASRNSSIWLYSLDSGERHQLTGDTSRERSPVFDPKGRWLYFLSDRDFNLTFSAYEFNFLYTNATRIYAAALSAEGAPFYPQRSDEVGAGQDGKGQDGNGKSEGPTRIDIPGFASRVQALKVPAGQYGGLSANAKGVFFVAAGNGRGTLRFIGADDDEPKDVASITGYALSADGDKLLLRRGTEFSVVEAKPDAKFDSGKIDLGDMQLRIEPRREWRQLFVDGWRILRDVFYEPGMHGQDWPAIRAKYESLLPHVASRADLDYLLQEIAGEANAGHVYVEAGDQVRVARKPGGLLGAELVPDASGYVRIEKIFAGENWDKQRRSPLTEPGVKVAEGELILAIDGQSTRGVDNVYRLLENKADRLVELRVAKRPDDSAARTVRVHTIDSELSLRYLDWVAERRRMVEAASDGRIGYIHVPNTAVEGSREMFQGLLAYGSRDALIIDDRYNGGGFIPDRMVEWLSRTPLNYWKQRGLEPNATPLLSHRGPKAMLINGLSSSGGDALPYYFRKLQLGPLIGTRTWGGLIGIQSGSNPRLADGGAVLAASFRFLDTEGRWAVEDEGVSPDREVIDRPELVAAGRDPSLEAAIAHLMAELQRNPPRPVTAPPAPTQFPRE
ncbi:S41 family peptidase [Pseudomarimonas salicorniae]|uniref:Tricorn protease homolog n=1 Tax=Pseudomarimonas salicorniae TaxID=2933270 RepID=A0ABT0GL09_9GAMM|nr:S41 family peptidase [Lysobacter sp. CAU 1642]MCK7595067.1 PDZ domain-containing protein [Lysobacter sp. CAU 1642]